MPFLWNCLCPRRRSCTPPNKRRKYSTSKSKYTQHVSKNNNNNNKDWTVPRYIDSKCLAQSVHPLPPKDMPYISDTLPWYKRNSSSSSGTTTTNNVKTEQPTVVVRPGLAIQQSIFAGVKTKLTTGPRVHQPRGEHPSDPDAHSGGVLQSPRGQASSGRSPRRPHVQEIFLDVSHSQSGGDQTLNMSFTSVTSSRWGGVPGARQCGYGAGGREGHPGLGQTAKQADRLERRQTDGLQQYTPRSLQEDAVTAALLGNRVDDFVHDPGSWNQHIHLFAASPSPSRAFSASGRESPSPSPSLRSPQRSPSPGIVTRSSQRCFTGERASASHASHSDPSHSASRRPSSHTGRSGAGGGGQVAPGSGDGSSLNDDVFDDDHHRHSGRETQADWAVSHNAEDYFSPFGDVLY